MNPFQTNSGTLDEILFEKRNKSYGAYAIRQGYNNSVLKSLGITAAVFILGFFLLSLFVNTKNEIPTVIGPNTPPNLKITIYQLSKPKIKTPEIRKPATSSNKTALQTAISTLIKDSAEKKVADPLNIQLPTPANGSVTGVETVPGDGSVNVNTPPTNTSDAGSDNPETAPDVMPSFPGLQNFLARNLVYPSAARINEISGKVAVNFIVDEEGNIIQAKVIRKVGYGCDEEALRVIKLIPKGRPGLKAGKPVKVSFNQVITFQLQ